MLSQNDVIAQLWDAMRATGLIVNASDIIPNSPKFQRVKHEKDKGSRKNGYYKLFLDDQPAAVFGCWSTGEKHEWFAETGSAPMSEEQRKFQREKMQRLRADRDAEIKQGHEKAAERAKKIWDKAVPATDDHPYLQRKGVKGYGLRIGKWWKWDHETGKPYLACDNALLVPKYGLKRDIRSLQAIFPGKVEINGEQRDKDYLGGAEKIGMFHVIGKPLEVDGKKVVIIAEGYATGATIHEVTGHCVLIAFDTGNLLHTAKVFRDKYPDATIIFAADNDWGTVKPISNPGVHYANKAAAAVGGVVAVPQFEDMSGKGGDFNDLREREGLAAVEACINAALYPEEVPEEDGEPEQPEQQGGGDDTATTDAVDKSARAVEKEGGFTILGYDEGTYFLLLHEKKQIMAYKAGFFSVSGLTEIADPNFWELHFPSKNGINANAAMNFIIRTAHRRGIFNPLCVRARGAWWDGDRFIVNLGRKLLVDGVSMELGRIGSQYIYCGGWAIADPSDTPLTADEGQRLFNVAKMFRWERESSAALLIGWIFLSPICGALRWRPHGWLTGGPGSGKTTILKDFVRDLLPAGMNDLYNGDSTEAGIRQEWRGDARPLVMDEVEGDVKSQAARVERNLVMLRQASSNTGARTLRGTTTGTAMSFSVTAMALLSSIGVGLERTQDKERVTTLDLKPKREGDEEYLKAWPTIKAALSAIKRDRTLSARVFRRAINMSRTIVEAIDIFAEAFARADALGTVREGDQLGALLAGYWCLTHDQVPTMEEAQAEIRRNDWKVYKEDKAEEQEDLIATLLARPISCRYGDRVSVGNLVARAAGYKVDGLAGTEPNAADRELHNFGMKVSSKCLYIHPNNDEFSKLMQETNFSSGLRGRLKRIDGALVVKSVRIGMTSTNGVSIPVKVLLGDHGLQMDHPFK